MHELEPKRISRLIALVTLLQSKRLITASELANKFSVSVRTIYRDIRALEQAGVPISVEEGKGYSMMEHYRIPPVMFTEEEANALITAEQLVLLNKDTSFRKAYSDAVTKIKAVLKHSLKEKTDLLAERMYIWQTEIESDTSDHLSRLQFALTNYFLTSITYSDGKSTETNRLVEPFALVGSTDKWLLIAWCRLRNDFRHFRLDRIVKLSVLQEQFEPQKMSMQEYYEKYF